MVQVGGKKEVVDAALEGVEHILRADAIASANAKRADCQTRPAQRARGKATHCLSPIETAGRVTVPPEHCPARRASATGSRCLPAPSSILAFRLLEGCPGGNHSFR